MHGKLFVPLLRPDTPRMFAYAPIVIAGAPYESSMGLVQKIFYFHVPVVVGDVLGVGVCGVASAIYLFKGRPAADRWAVSGGGTRGALRADGAGDRPLWGRKAWGVWWQWDARLTIALLLWLVFIAYLLVRKYGGPGSEKLAAAVGVFGTAVVAIRLRVGQHLANGSPDNERCPDAPAGACRGHSGSAWRHSCCCSSCCSTCASTWRAGRRCSTSSISQKRTDVIKGLLGTVVMRSAADRAGVRSSSLRPDRRVRACRSAAAWRATAVGAPSRGRVRVCLGGGSVLRLAAVAASEQGRR